MRFALSLCVVALLAAQAVARPWTNPTTGKSVEAELMSVQDGVVYLKAPSGKMMQVPIERLSPADQEFVKNPENSKGVLKAAAQEAAQPKPVQVDTSGSDRFTAAIKDKPNDAMPYVTRSMMLTTQKKYKEAMTDLEMAMKLDPNNAAVYNARGKLLSKQGDPLKAHEDFSTAIKLDPKFAAAYRNRGDNMVELQKRPEAKAMFEEEVEKYKKHWADVNKANDKSTPWQPLNSTNNPVTGPMIAMAMKKLDYIEADRYDVPVGVTGGVSGGYSYGAHYGGQKGCACGGEGCPACCKFCKGKGCDQCQGSKMNPPLAVYPTEVTAGETVTLVANPSELRKGMPQKLGGDGKPLMSKPKGPKGKPEPLLQDVTGVDFYRDIDGDNKFDGEKDEGGYLGSDADGSDGYSLVVKTEGFNPGTQAYFAVPKGSAEAAAAMATTLSHAQNKLRAAAQTEKGFNKKAADASVGDGFSSEAADAYSKEQSEVQRDISDVLKKVADQNPEVADLLTQAKKAVSGASGQLARAKRTPDASKGPAQAAAAEAGTAAELLNKAADMLAKKTGSQDGTAVAATGTTNGAPGSGGPGAGGPGAGGPGSGSGAPGSGSGKPTPPSTLGAGKSGMATNTILPGAGGDGAGGPGAGGPGKGGYGGRGGRGGDDADRAVVNNYYNDAYGTDTDANRDVVLDRARDYLAEGDVDRALVGYDRLIEENPGDVTVLRDRAGTYLNTGRVDYAIRDYNRLVNLAPQNYEFYYNRGCAYMSAGQLDEAIADFTTSLELDELGKLGNRAYNNRGGCYAKKGEYKIAIDDFNDAIRITPDDPLAHRNRALANKKLGQMKEYEVDFAKFKELSAQ